LNIQKPTRELSIEESLKWTFDLYVNHFPTLFLPAFLASVITGSLSTLLAAYALDMQSLLIDLITGDSNLLITTIGLLLAAAVVGSLVSWILSTLASGICVKCASDIIEKGSANLEEAFSFTAKKLLTLLAASFLVGALLVIGALMLVVPGIIFAIMFALVIPVIINENVGVLDSMSRSKRLVNHRWLITFVLFLIVGMVSIFVSLIALFLTSPFGIVGSLISSIIASFAAPVLSIAMTVYYYSMLGREEQQRFTLPPPPF
jgi:MFS family permease